MRKTTLLAVSVTVIGLAIVAVAGVGPPADGAIWGDGQLFRTVGTPSNLPDHGPKDGLFVFSGLEGQAAVAEAIPGDRDYNGGRWQVYGVSFTEQGIENFDTDHDGVVDMPLTSWEEVQQHISMGDLEQTGMGPSFVCPMIP